MPRHHLPRSGRILIRVLVISLVAAAVAACEPSTTLEQVWRAPITQYQQPPLQRVVTVYYGENESMRRSAEDQLARDLLKRGVQATPGYAVLTSDELKNLDTAKRKLLSMGYDGLVTMRIVDREQDLEYMPGYNGYWGWGGYYGGWGGLASEGYFYTETLYRIETNAYSLRTNQLVWAALTRTTDPANAREMINETTDVVASQLTERGLAG
jgi:hypothetical protein